MTIAYGYRRIGAALVTEVVDLLQSRQSIALLGPRNVGKRYAIRLIRDRLLAEGRQVGVVRFFPPEAGGTATSLSEQSPGVTLLPADVNGVYDWVDRTIAESGVAILIATNIDALPHEAARQLLVQARVRIEASHALSLALTGEVDLSELLCSPLSEFTSDHRLVVTGFALDEFMVAAKRYLTLLQRHLANEEATLQQLYERTGGSLFFLRLLLWTAFDEWAVRDNTQHNRAGEMLDLPDLTPQRLGAQLAWNHYLRCMTGLIRQSPRTWPLLEGLLQGSCTAVPDTGPHILELAGVAIRSNDHFVPSSPLVHEFLRSYYTPQRIGDLYANVGDWGAAIDRYRPLSAVDKVRPASIADVPDADRITKTLCTSLFVESTKGSNQVKQRFVDGCLHVMGFSEVTFWRYTDWPGHADWSSLGEKLLAEECDYRSILPNPVPKTYGLLPLPTSRETSVVAAVLPTRRGDQTDVVIVGNPTVQNLTSKSRQRLTRELVQHFVQAYEHAVRTELDAFTLRIREQYASIMDSITAGLGTEVKDPLQAIRYAAQGLRKLEYKRVLFCLVDPSRRMIEGVLEDSVDETQYACRHTRYRLTEPRKDVQPYVIATAQAEIVHDALSSPLTNKPVVRVGGMKNMAIVPLVNPQGIAIGTVHVEREDELPPTREEVTDLLQFGRKLAVLVEQSERVNLLQTALDRQPEPIVILDRRMLHRYVNEPAAHHLEIPAGWREPKRAMDESRHIKDRPNGNTITTLRPIARRTVRKGNRNVQHLRVVTGAKHHDVAVFSEEILDSRKQRVGALCHIQDLSYLYRVFAALQRLQAEHDTPQIVNASTEALKALGHSWGRRYLIDNEEKAPRLIGRGGFGFTSPDVELMFTNDSVVLPSTSNTTHWECWKCLHDESPLVCCYYPDKPDRMVITTDRGLPMLNVRAPYMPELLRKTPGDSWIDFPLLAASDPVGKVTLPRSEEFGPEDFEFLKVLCDLTRSLLGASRRWEGEFKDKTVWMEQNAEQVTRDTCHHFLTNFAAFAPLLERYRRESRGQPALEKLNARMAQLYAQISLMLSQTRERLLRDEIRPARHDLLETIRSAFSALPDQFEIDAPGDSFEMDFDSATLESALLELANNATKFAHDRKLLHVQITVSERSVAKLSSVRIEVADNGPGVPDEFKQRIFNQFFSRDPRDQRGTGFGLAFVKRIVARHGGSIRENGVSGHGARFVLDLPRFTAP
jgi:two-component sensor histidine kinase